MPRHPIGSILRRRGRASRSSGDPPRGWRTLGVVVLVGVLVSCGRTIEEEPPIPEHRYGVCESWCAMMFDPVCPAQEVEVETEEECVESCLVADIIWAPLDPEHDACAPTHIPYVECLETLSCEEIQQHFALTNIVPAEERSTCGELLRAQLDCQSAHY